MHFNKFNDIECYDLLSKLNNKSSKYWFIILNTDISSGNIYDFLINEERLIKKTKIKDKIWNFYFKLSEEWENFIIEVQELIWNNKNKSSLLLPTWIWLFFLGLIMLLLNILESTTLIQETLNYIKYWLYLSWILYPFTVFTRWFFIKDKVNLIKKEDILIHIIYKVLIWYIITYSILGILIWSIYILVFTLLN
jgi:hypothetical protein